jgi:putative FmdB family regulatory protein
LPTYGYECSSCKEQFEVIQKITEEALKVHEGCGGALKRLVFPVGIAFKGSGFYVNDYARATPKGETAPASGDAKPAASSDTKSETKSETKTESKSETKPETKPAAAAPAAKSD